MKRVLVASILGLATIATTYGQANFIFDTYSAAVAPYGGLKVVDASLTPVADGTQVLLSWTGSVTAGSLAGQVTSTVGAYGPGWIVGPSFSTAANYVAGSPLTFTLQAWQGAVDFASASIKGTFSWVEPGVGAALPADKFLGIPATTDIGGGVMGSYLVLTVPEPSTLALAGLGAAALLAYRRRQ